MELARTRLLTVSVGHSSKSHLELLVDDRPGQQLRHEHVVNVVDYAGPGGKWYKQWEVRRVVWKKLP